MRLRILLLLAAVSALTVTCSKSTTQDGTILGTWIATESLISPGPMGTWQPWTNGVYVAIFHEDGRLELTKPFLTLQYDRYKVVDDNILRMYTSSLSDSTDIGYELNGKKLTLWLFCIEPCGIRFARPQK